MTGGASQPTVSVDPVALATQCEQLIPLAKRDQFYGPQGEMALGTGIIIRSAALPVYVPEADAYGTGKGPALVLTHECDIDPDNIRPFSDKALVAPLIRLDAYLTSAKEECSAEEMISFATNVARGNTNRLLFLPRFGDETSPLFFGAIIDLNYLVSCGVTSLAKSTVVCALSGYAIGALDRALQNHLFRPKADHVPLPH